MGGRPLYIRHNHLVGDEYPASGRPLEPVLPVVHDYQLCLYLHHDADAVHRPEYEIYEVDDVPDAADVLLCIQRLRSRSELLLPAVAVLHNPADNDFRWTINDKKLLAQMEANAKKKGNGQKKSGFMERLEKMQREQQRMARENAKAQAKRMR